MTKEVRPKTTKYELDGVLYDTPEEMEDEKFRKMSQKHLKFANTRLKTKTEVKSGTV